MTKLRTYAKKRTPNTATLAPEPVQSMFEAPTNTTQTQGGSGAAQSSGATLVQMQSMGHQLGRVGVFPSLDSPTVQRKRRNQDLNAPSSLMVQPKLAVGEPGDAYEQEADRVAAQVVDRLDQRDAIAAKQPGSAVQRKPAVTPQPSIQPLVQAQGGSGGMAAPAQLEQSINSARSGGSALSEDVKAPMEEAFGADFSGVKVHTDGNSDQLNRSLNSKAFTTNNDIFFKKDAYDPGSRDGKQLLAHELTHVVQQSGGMVQRSPMYVQRVSWGDIGKAIKKGWTAVHDTVKDKVEEIKTEPANDADTQKFKETVIGKKTQDGSIKSSLQRAGKGLLTGIAGGEASVTKYIVGSYAEGTYWERQTSLFSSESSDRLTKKKEIVDLLDKAQKEARGHMEKPIEEARGQVDKEKEPTTELEKHMRQRKLARLNKDNKSAKKDAGEILYQEASLAAATDIISNNSSATSAIDQGVTTYKKEFDAYVNDYVDGGADGVLESLHYITSFGESKKWRKYDRRVEIALDKKREGRFEKQVCKAAESKAASKAQEKVEETLSKDLELVKKYAEQIRTQQEKKEVQNKAVQSHVGGALSSFAALGSKIDLAIPDDGDEIKVDVTVSFPIPSLPGLFIDINFGGEAVREDGVVSLGLEAGIAAAGRIDTGAFKVEVVAGLGGYIETKGKDAAEAMTMISYGFYQNFRLAGVPSAIINGIWSMGGYSGKSEDEEVEQWSKAVKSSMSDDASVEIGGYGSAKAGAEGGVGKGATKVKGELEAKARSGLAYNKKSLTRAEEKTGAPAELRGSSEFRAKLDVGFGSGDFSYRTDYVEEPNTNSWLPATRRPVETRYRGGLGIILPSDGKAGMVVDTIVGVIDKVVEALKDAGVSWSEVERQKVKNKTDEEIYKERDQILNSSEPDKENAIKQNLSIDENLQRRKLSEEEKQNVKDTLETVYLRRAEKEAEQKVNEKRGEQITEKFAKSTGQGLAVKGATAAYKTYAALPKETRKAVKEAKKAGNLTPRRKPMPLSNGSKFPDKKEILNNKGLLDKVTKAIKYEGQTKFMVVVGGGKKENEFWKHSIALQKVSDMNLNITVAGGGVTKNTQQRKTIWKWKL